MSSGFVLSRACTEKRWDRTGTLLGTQRLATAKGCCVIHLIVTSLGVSLWASCLGRTLLDLLRTDCSLLCPPPFSSIAECYLFGLLGGILFALPCPCLALFCLTSSFMLSFSLFWCGSLAFFKFGLVLFPCPRFVNTCLSQMLEDTMSYPLI